MFFNCGTDFAVTYLSNIKKKRNYELEQPLFTDCKY